ncbi:hypothetical protein CR513_37725, partial [Mucuna pruriens]
MARTLLNNLTLLNISGPKLPILENTPYKGRQPNISHFHPFGCEFFILNTKNNLGKFDPKLDHFGDTQLRPKLIEYITQELRS